MSAPLLELEEITKSFGAVRALNGVSLTLRTGEVHALLGENGAGKSTLIKIITGAHTADGGRLIMEGVSISELTPSRNRELGIACIYQQPALLPDLSVAENIGLRLRPSAAFDRIDWEGRRREASALLKRVGADLDVDAEVRSLSMPQQQLVEIACALGAGARVVIMDEPTASLTHQEQTLLFEVVRDLRTRGIGVIYISHRLEEIFALADRVTVLRDGQSVGTFPAAGMSESQLIQHMVGRELSQVYPESRTTPGDVVLSLKNVGCQASGVRSVSFDLRAGEILGLAGLVGAGRTELARILFGLTPADCGSVELNGRPVQLRTPQEALQHGIAYVPEDRRRHGVILEMSIQQNISMAIHRVLFPWSWLKVARERNLAQRFIRDLGIKASGPDAPGSSLSGGNQQKVSVARWLATKPKVLILDEPTQGVDIGAKAEIHRIIRSLAEEGLAVLMISSDLPEILGMSDRIGVMRQGRLAGILPAKTDGHRVMTVALGQESPNQS